MRNIIKGGFLILALALLPLMMQSSRPVKSFTGEGSASSKRESFTGMGDVRGFMVGYNRWAAAYKEDGGDRYLNIPVAWVKGLSAEHSNAYGMVTIDLIEGAVSAHINNLDKEFDLWLLAGNDLPGNKLKTIVEKDITYVGRLTREQIDEVSPEGKHKKSIIGRLDAHIAPPLFSNFNFNKIVLTAPGQDPRSSFVLWGMPTLYQKLYLSELQGHFGLLNNSENLQTQNWTNEQGMAAVEDMIAQGRDLFVNETFNGNGRTCNTCHRETANFTITPDLIATLPPTDPLFVFKTNPNLANNFEKPDFLTGLALFVENVDGTDDLSNKFTLRSANHTLALSTSITPFNGQPGKIDFTTLPPNQRTGWSGDGAPGTGTLREFAIGATMQHFTRSLNRSAGVDFRLPTDVELDALEAFQLSLGRQEDLDLKKLVLKGNLSIKGQKLFLDDTKAKCNACHFNAGANTGFGNVIGLPGTDGQFNGSFETDVDLLSDAPKIPLDGGFGQVRRSDGAFGDPRQRAFNTPPLVEAADTAPLFHNNGIKTIEDSVAFYKTSAFNNGPSGKKFPVAPFKGGIKLTNNQIKSISAFLRVLNVLENIRSSIAIQQRAIMSTDDANAKQLASFSIGEDNDAIQVISNGAGLKVTGSAQVKQILTSAQMMAQSATTAPDKQTRDQLLNQAITLNKMARDLLVDPSTLPASFQQ